MSFLHLHSEEPAKKSSQTIVKLQTQEAIEQLQRPFWSLFLSSFSAGLDIGFSLLLMLAVLESTPHFSPLSQHTLVSLMYSVGFIFVILGRSELFTEHTTLAVIPWLGRKITLLNLIRLWTIVFSANIIGVAIFTVLTIFIAPATHLIQPQTFAQLGSSFVQLPPHLILISAILAGWLMGLLSWLVTASRDTISQIVLVTIVATSIGFLHLHHSIIGSAEVMAAVFVGALTWYHYFYFIFWTVLGNIFGGAVFVALLKYGHASLTKH